MSTTENKAVIAAFIEEVINQKRLERADDLVLENFVELDPLPGQQQGREGLKGILGMLFAAFPDMHWVIDETVAEGNNVVTRFTWTGRHGGPFMGMPATGKSVTVKGVVMDKLVGGKMAESRILMDNMGMMMQLGAIPAP